MQTSGLGKLDFMKVLQAIPSKDTLVSYGKCRKARELQSHKQE